MKHGFNELIAAFQIFKKYTEDAYPLGCEHDVLYVFVDPKIVSEKDKETLEEMGFLSETSGFFISYRYGAA